MASVSLSLDTHKDIFTEQVLPTVERHARVVFRYLLRREDDHADAIADCVAHAWEGYVLALRHGKEPWLFPSMLATFAARRTKVGRKIGKREKARDVFNAARSNRISLVYLEEREADWQDAVKDNSETPPPDQAAFRLDFPAWLTTLTARNRKIATTLAVGHSATDVAERFKLTRGRVTQLRQQLMNEWEIFTA